MAENLDESTFHQTLKDTDLALVDFWAEWCMPCKMLEPVLAEVEKEMSGKLKFFRLNVDENPNIASEYGIEGIPTLIVFKQGKPLNAIVGFRPKAQLEKDINESIN
ncbi:thioredoxin [Candidatus Parvarchaeota archaeon]|jgi:thioredoxin|uniref:Thioredoxin n=1 Tax=Candidatus Acidifodinimicrobium mancum TaxID=2898728 RepID=A0A8T3UZI5_9ARCH|nr:thioredoxin [Candidatus Acidifodinimicrobium mancum]MBE5729541.1 thioredoxin [Candidatus Acidifodinimicrobium mancum]MBE5730229.1 thioredoxin [Candidatus Acidifodinimicrobium mancum]